MAHTHQGVPPAVAPPPAGAVATGAELCDPGGGVTGDEPGGSEAELGDGCGDCGGVDCGGGWGVGAPGGSVEGTAPGA